MLIELIIRFVLGGLIVSLFAVIGDVLKPKTVAGVFGGAPSVALATLGLTFITKGPSHAATDGRSMIFGAVGMLVYSALIAICIFRYRWKTKIVVFAFLPVWLVVALGLEKVLAQ